LIRKLLKIILKTVLTLVLLVIVLLLSLNVTAPFLKHVSTANDYSDWMGETLADSARIIDVAMLGAHDAFTANINIFSAIDEASADSIQTGLTGQLIKGFSVKQSRTQVSDATTLFEAGVRYFDIRLTYNESEEAWYTTHTYFSEPFLDVLMQINDFLDAHPTEFVLLDIQHVNGVDLEDATAMTDAYDEIKALFIESGVEEHCYKADQLPLSQITYGDITVNQTQGGCLAMTKLLSPDALFFDYGASVRSAWPNTDDTETALAFLETEAMTIALAAAMTGNQMSENPLAVDSLGAFRIMQAVLTMQMNVDGILQAIGEWTLLNRAVSFNAALLESPHFEAWLIAMPVVMVDYANGNQADWNDRVMTILLEFNQNLT